MAINRNDRSADYINNVDKVFQLVADDGNASTEEQIAYSGTPNGVVVLHGANKSLGSASIAATVVHDKGAGTMTLEGIGAAATPSDAPLVVDLHYKDILGYLGCFSTANRPASPATNAVIYDGDLGLYMRYEGGAWAEKTNNYQDPGVVSDIYSSISIAISAATAVGNKTINQAAWDASVYGDNVRDVFSNGGTLDLTPYLNNPSGTGSIFANVITDKTNAANLDNADLVPMSVAIDQTTRTLTLTKTGADGAFLVEWGVA